MWFSKLSASEKAAILNTKFSYNTYNDIFDLADKAWVNAGSGAAPPVVAATKSSKSASNPSEGTPEPDQVSAVSARGTFRGRNNRGFRGGGRGRGTGRGGQQNNNSSNQNQTQSQGQKPHQRGPRHPDGPPDSSCSRHWSQGKGATYCSDPLVCGWANFITPRSKNNN